MSNSPSTSSSCDCHNIIDEEFDLLEASKLPQPVSSEIPKLPLGFKFLPKDDELIIFFLTNKILDRPLPFNVIEQKDNLYSLDPDQLNIEEFKHCREEEAYYFTCIDEEYSKGSELKTRVTERGYWEQIEEEKEIFSKSFGNNKVIIGFKKEFLFYWGKQPNGESSSWIIDEYRLNPKLVFSDKFSDSTRTKVEIYVVCKIKSMTNEEEDDDEDLSEFEPSDSEEEELFYLNNVEEGRNQYDP